MSNRLIHNEYQYECDIIVYSDGTVGLAIPFENENTELVLRGVTLSAVAKEITKFPEILDRLQRVHIGNPRPVPIPPKQPATTKPYLQPRLRVIK